MTSLSRRNFLAAAGSTAAAISVPALFPQSATAKGVGLPIGIQLYTVSKPLEGDTAGTLKQLKSFGYEEVETAGLAKHSAKEFRGLLDDAGLKCPSAHLDLMDENLDSVFADASTLGAKYAVSSVLRSFHFDPKKPAALDPLGLDGFKKVAAHMNEVGRKARAAGLQFAYHNHNFEFEKLPDGRPGYDLLLAETDRELVKFEIDCGWMTVAGYNPVTYFHAHPGRFRMLHIKDFKPISAPVTVLGGSDMPEGSDLGQGFVQYAPIFAAARSAGIEHVFAEQEGPFRGSRLDAAKLDAAFLKKFR